MAPLHPGETYPQSVLPGQGRQAGELGEGAARVSLATRQALRCSSYLFPLSCVGEALHPLLPRGCRPLVQEARGGNNHSPQLLPGHPWSL